MSDMVASGDYGHALRCPRCGGANLHQDGLWAHPDRSQDGLRIAFWCEACEEPNDRCELRITYHKGTTYVVCVPVENGRKGR